VFEYFIALIAGLVSFLSPCVLPLVPAYISYMGGRVANTISAQVAVSGTEGEEAQKAISLAARFSTFLHGIAFVMGFTFVFVSLGIIGAAFVNTSTVESIISRIGGVLIIAFGLHFMGIVPKIFAWLRRHNEIVSSVFTSLVIAVVVTVIISWGFAGTVALWDTAAYPAWTGIIVVVTLMGFWLWLVTQNAFVTPGVFWNNTMNRIDYMFYADTRRQMTAKGDQGLGSSALMGLIFAAGWTPCIGPTLGVAWTMAANGTGTDIPHAAALMTAYSLGLGIPFLLAALMLDSAQGGLRRLRRHMATIQMVSGAFLVAIGVLIASGNLQNISNNITAEFGDFTYTLEECTVDLLEGDISFGQFGDCMRGDDLGETAEAENEVIITDLPTLEELEVGLAINNLAPDFETVNTEGETVMLSDFRGQLVLLNFWYTYCAPCRIEMPEFQSAFSDYSDDGFTIVTVNREQTAEEIIAFADELDLSFPMLLDADGSIQSLYRIIGYPTTFVIDPDGVIMDVKLGAMTAAEIQALVEDVVS
jgi:cytochrome c biogenesis protein CcdA/peroxiredoxin